MPVTTSQRILGNHLPEESCEVLQGNLSARKIDHLAPRFSTRQSEQMEILEPDKIDYRIRQSREDLQYAREYEKWTESLPPDERQQLASLGLDRPSAPGYSSGVGISGDAADNAIAEPQAPAEDEEIHDWRVASDLRAAEAIAKLVSELLATDPSLTIETLALVSGIAYEGASESAVARKYQVTRAAVSKRCIELGERLGIKNFRAMKSEQARETYRQRAIEAHKAAGRETSDKPPRAARVETMGVHASRSKAVWKRVKKSDWFRNATAAELLLARRSLRPAFQVADEIEHLLREKGDPAILAELDRDLVG